MSDWVTLVLATGLGILSLTADLIGVGGYRGFGWKQILGTLVATVVAAWAALRIARRDRGNAP